MEKNKSEITFVTKITSCYDCPFLAREYGIMYRCNKMNIEIFLSYHNNIHPNCPMIGQTISFNWEKEGQC